MKIIIASVLFFLLTNSSGFAQGGEVYDVEFHFEHSMRIPYHSVDVKINRHGQVVTVTVKVQPGSDEEQWAKGKIDTTFVISQEKFQQVINSVKKIAVSDIIKNIGYLGFDGSTGEIMFGDYGNSITYKTFTPESETEKRGLTDFMNACEEIIKAGGLKPDVVFATKGGRR